MVVVAGPRIDPSPLPSEGGLERVNKGIKRRTNVVAIFPNEAGLLRLGGSILVEATTSGRCAERR